MRYLSEQVLLSIIAFLRIGRRSFLTPGFIRKMNCDWLIRSLTSSVKELIGHLTTLFAPFAEKHNLSFTSFGSEITPSSVSSSSGALRLSDAYDTQLDPAPITPTDTAAYRILSGSIRATHARSVIPNPKSQDMIVAPMLAGGNTGT